MGKTNLTIPSYHIQLFIQEMQSQPRPIEKSLIICGI